MSARVPLQREIPSVDQILHEESMQGLQRLYSRKLVRSEIQRYLEELRASITESKMNAGELAARLASLPATVSARLNSMLAPSLRKVINASGVILHTNVGRAPLASASMEFAREVACSYSNLEFDLEKGERSHRDQHFENRIARLLGCESATVVNNNAAAVFLILNTLAAGRRVLVSRGELIEIGGSFRIPDIMARSGATLSEVGTTNRTSLKDYAEAIDETVGLILRVHPSNYKIVGFTERPDLGELVSLAHRNGIPLVKDAGSGYVFPISLPALRNEPSVSSALSLGADLVCFSGDKLLGGPQAGIIVGERHLVDKVRRNPLMRVCRVDKFTYAALDWVLNEYEKGTYQETVPIYQMLLADVNAVRGRAESMAARLTTLGIQVDVMPGLSLIGGGSAPGETLPTVLLSVRSSRLSPGALERLLRQGKPAILTRLEDDRLLLDLRTVFPEEEQAIFDALSSLFEPADEEDPR